jgi:hypothetical protein
MYTLFGFVSSKEGKAPGTVYRKAYCSTYQDRGRLIPCTKDFVYVLAALGSVGIVATIVCYYVWAGHIHIRASSLRTIDSYISKSNKSSRKIKSLQQVTKGSVIIATNTSFVMFLHIAIPVATNGLLSSMVPGGGEGRSGPPHSWRGRTGLLLSKAHTWAHWA